MKKLSLVFTMVVCMFLISGMVYATGDRTGLRKFKISVVDDIYMGGNVEKIWKLSYSSNETPITVLKRKTAGGTFYVVHSKFFEVCYANTKTGFGVKKVKEAWRNVPKKITRAVLNPQEFKRQQIISVNKADDERALGLIASYLPDLINDGYTHLLN